MVKLTLTLRKLYGRHHDLINRYGIAFPCRQQPNPLSTKSWYELIDLEYRLNWEVYTPYTCATEMLLHINGKVTRGKWNHLFCREVCLRCWPSMSTLKCRSRYEADVAVVGACFVDRCLSFCTFSLCHCVVSSSSIYGFWLPLWYLQTRVKLKAKTLLENVKSKKSKRVTFISA